MPLIFWTGEYYKWYGTEPPWRHRKSASWLLLQQIAPFFLRSAFFPSSWSEGGRQKEYSFEKKVTVFAIALQGYCFGTLLFWVYTLIKKVEPPRGVPSHRVAKASTYWSFCPEAARVATFAKKLQYLCKHHKVYACPFTGQKEKSSLTKLAPVCFKKYLSECNCFHQFM